MSSRCTRCGRDRPDTSTILSCPHGGTCDWGPISIAVSIVPPKARLGEIVIYVDRTGEHAAIVSKDRKHPTMENKTVYDIVVFDETVAPGTRSVLGVSMSSAPEQFKITPRRP